MQAFNSQLLAAAMAYDWWLQVRIYHGKEREDVSEEWDSWRWPLTPSMYTCSSPAVCSQDSSAMSLCDEGVCKFSKGEHRQSTRSDGNGCSLPPLWLSPLADTFIEFISQEVASRACGGGAIASATI